MELAEIFLPEERSEICGSILRSLPRWFGIPESIGEYVELCRELSVFAIREEGRAVAFAALKRHNPWAAEVAVMGVREDCHRRGLGRQLIERCVSRCREEGIEYLQVKTLDGSCPNEDYARTRAFYFAMGFRPLQCFPDYWDEQNPCLVMVRAV